MLKKPDRGPPGRNSCRNPLARGLNKLFAGWGAKIVATLLVSFSSLLICSLHIPSRSNIDIFVLVNVKVETRL